MTIAVRRNATWHSPALWILPWGAMCLAAVVATAFQSALADDVADRLREDKRTDMTAGEMEFPGAALLNTGRPPFLARVTVTHEDGIYREGETLQIGFMAEEESYMYLLYHQADGSSVLLFPNIAAPDNRVAVGTRVDVPPAGLPTEKQYRFRIQSPFGQEVLQVLASRQPIAELDELAAKSRIAAPVTAELIAGLAKKLASDTDLWTEHRVRIRTVSKDGRVDQPDSDRPANNDRPTNNDRPNNLNPDNATMIAAKRVGLFIGIGEYENPELAANHAELATSARVMHDLMLQHGGLDQERIKLVLNKQATREALQRMFLEWLPAVSDPGDLVFVYFSGHAGQFPTDDPKEPDGQDEALAPYDLSAGDKSLPIEDRRRLLRDSNILDDTLARWLEELNGRQIVLILDTCHSGGLIADNKGLSSRSFFEDEAARIKDIAMMNTLVMASCAADEQSLFQGTPNDSMWFTYCLTEAIEQRKTSEALTAQDAFAYAANRMKELLVESDAGREQQPTMSDRILLPVVLTPATVEQ